MAPAKPLTLNDVKRSKKITTKVLRVSDFMEQGTKEEIRCHRARGKVKAKPYDGVDAYTAEILARFGWEAYQAWQTGAIDERKMARMVAAERARDKRRLLGLEAILAAAVAGANNPTKQGHAPKSLKSALKLLKEEEKRANGK